MTDLLIALLGYFITIASTLPETFEYLLGEVRAFLGK